MVEGRDGGLVTAPVAVRTGVTSVRGAPSGPLRSPSSSYLSRIFPWRAALPPRGCSKMSPNWKPWRWPKSLCELVTDNVWRELRVISNDAMSRLAKK
jgi:hypothetical protein